jgi:transcriptional regulator with PAS, ATPase and Fis domain
MYEEFKIYQHACEDLYRILEETFEEITIADKHGTILFTSKATQTYLFNNNIVGLNVYDLERLGIVNKSAIRLVLEQKKRVQFVQTTANKKTLLVTAIPVFDDKKQLIRVISMSNDITEIEKLKVQLTYTENLITTLRKQLRQLKSFEDKIIPSNNARMKKIFTLIKNISNLDSNIMLLGETGTGKSFIAKKIHEFSTRKNYEFVQINCGAIPENLLEAELFGYKEGAFTGAAQKGKVGLIEVAKNGTLFLDEIGDLIVPPIVKTIFSSD